MQDFGWPWASPFHLALPLLLRILWGIALMWLPYRPLLLFWGLLLMDAIIVAENISKKMRMGLPIKQAATVGTLEVLPPILASIITTCIAFLPLLFLVAGLVVLYRF